jgi:hypothetical protein
MRDRATIAESSSKMHMGAYSRDTNNQYKLFIFNILIA